MKCTRKSQTDSKMHGKVGKTTEEIRKDDQWPTHADLRSAEEKPWPLSWMREETIP